MADDAGLNGGISQGVRKFNHCDKGRFTLGDLFRPVTGCWCWSDGAEDIRIGLAHMSDLHMCNADAGVDGDDVAWSRSVEGEGHVWLTTNRLRRHLGGEILRL